MTDEKDEEFKQSGGVERLAGFAWFEEEDAGPEEDVGFWKREFDILCFSVFLLFPPRSVMDRTE